MAVEQDSSRSTVSLLTMRILGWVRTSLIDYPHHIATVLFMGGCNFRCPMCHNADLVLHSGAMPSLPEKELWTHLENRTGKVTGVVVTGGEPTISPDLPDFLRALRDYDVALKLDTNGYRPDVLHALLDAGLVDYVAMDVKAPPARYAALTGVPDLDVALIERSIALLSSSGISHEFRTTIVPGMLTADDVEAIARWIGSDARYVLQQFCGAHTLDPSLEGRTPYPVLALQGMADRARRWMPNVVMRGL